MILLRTEDAIIARLRLGLGRMVTEVGSYGGELDDGLPSVIRRFPAAWVTFGGVTKTEPTSTRRDKFKAHGQFVVMVGQRNVRGEAAGRRGGPAQGEVGTYPLVYAVRRLLSGQDMDLPIDPLTPGRVRTLFNTRLEDQAFSVFACEFATAWLENALPNGNWPCPAPAGTPEAATDPDAVFGRYGGKSGEPDPEWLRTGLNYHLAPDDGQADAQDLLTMRTVP